MFLSQVPTPRDPGVPDLCYPAPRDPRDDQQVYVRPYQVGSYSYIVIEIIM